MKYKFILLLVLVIYFGLDFRVRAIDKDLKLYDNADIFTNIEEEQIKNRINDYIDKYNMDLVIVTISINTYKNTESFMDNFYHDNNFGVTSKKSGTIMTIDLDNKKYEFISYGEMQKYLDDKRIDNIYNYVDQMYKDNNKDYYVLSMSFIEKLNYYVSLGIASSNKDTYISDDGVMHDKKVFPIFFVTIFSFVISSIITLIFTHKSKMIKQVFEANNYIDYQNINITNRYDQFVTTHLTRIKKSNNSNSSGGSPRIGGTTISGNHSSGHGGRSL